jgi:hypothetical protein
MVWRVIRALRRQMPFMETAQPEPVEARRSSLKPDMLRATGAAFLKREDISQDGSPCLASNRPCGRRVHL